MKNRNAGGSDVFKHGFTFTVFELPRDGLLFVSKAAPPLMIWKDKLLGERSLVIDKDGRLGLIVGGLVVNRVTGQLNIDHTAMIKFYEKKGVMAKNVKRQIEIQTVLLPDNYAGSTRVLLDGEVVLLYAVDKEKGIV